MEWPTGLSVKSTRDDSHAAHTERTEEHPTGPHQCQEDGRLPRTPR